MKSFDDYIIWRVESELTLQKSFFYEDDSCIVDFIGRFENLEIDINQVANTIGIKIDSIEKKMRVKKD